VGPLLIYDFIYRSFLSAELSCLRCRADDIKTYYCSCYEFVSHLKRLLLIGL